MHWTVAATFTVDPALDRWLVPFVPGDRHRFTLIPARPVGSWHRRGRVTGPAEWAQAFQQAHAAWRASRGGIVTVFPQLAVMSGLHQRTVLNCKPVVAWCFNMGATYGGIKRTVARAALARVDRFVVHSTAEVQQYSEWLRLPRERFRFVHLQRAPIAVMEDEDTERPFVLAMGSARRDYRTFLQAARQSKLPTIVVAARHALEGLTIPENVQVRSSLPIADCHRLAQRARVNVIPVLNSKTASGQVTIVEAMRMGRALIATRTIGSEDYVQHGLTGLLVEQQSVEALRDAIERLWNDAPLRARLSENATRFVEERCSDAAAGKALREVLDEVEEEFGRRKHPWM